MELSVVTHGELRDELEYYVTKADQDEFESALEDRPTFQEVWHMIEAGRGKDSPETFKDPHETMARAGAPWDSTEDKRLRESFEDFLAKASRFHKRSIGAIRARLAHLDLTAK